MAYKTCCIGKKFTTYKASRQPSPVIRFFLWNARYEQFLKNG